VNYHSKKYALSWLLLLSSCLFYGQNKKIDSLQAYLKTAKEDTQYVNASLALTRQYLKTSNYDVALTQALKTQELCKKLLLADNGDLALFLKRNLAAANNNEGIVYYYKSEFSKCLECYGKALKWYEEIDDKKGIANCINNQGLIYYTQANYEKAYENYSKAKTIREEIKDETGLASSYNTQALKAKLNDMYGIANSHTNIG